MQESRDEVPGWEKLNVEYAANIHFKFIEDNVSYKYIHTANEHVIKANCMQYNEQVLVDEKEANNNEKKSQRISARMRKKLWLNSESSKTNVFFSLKCN